MTRILVVDDSEEARGLTVSHLAAAGYTDVETAGSGREALDRLAGDTTFDAILLDVVMADIDGIETCARIRADLRHADIPVLMVTEQSDADSLAQAFVAGATDYVAKPVRRIELTARLRSALRLKAELDRRRARENEAKDAAPTPELINPLTRLPGRVMLESALAAAPPGSGVIAVMLDQLGQAGTPREAACRALARLFRTVQAPLGCLFADLGDGLFVILLPPATDPIALAGTLLSRLRTSLLPAPVEGLSGRLHASFGCTVTDHDPRTALTMAVAAVERASADGGDRLEDAR